MPMDPTAMRRPLVAGNWKMHKDHVEAIHLVQDIALRLAGAGADHVEVAVHPPFTDLRTVQRVLDDRRIPVELGAQHCSDHDAGAYTGEIAPPMLARLGVRYVLVGHSERRQHFGMDDRTVAATLRAVLDHGMTPICCVGESAEERDAGSAPTRLADQVRAATGTLAPEAAASLVVAYEPIWAIGTGRAAGADDAQEACATVRAELSELFGADTSSRTRVLYGGSVVPENAAELVECPDVDGALVGSASLEGGRFVDIIRAVAGCYRSV